MGLNKGQTNNRLGRPKGVKNKITRDLRKFIDELLNDNRQLFMADLGKLEPRDRVAMFEKLLHHVLPKQQLITVEAQIQAEYAAIEKLLDNMPESGIEAVTERLIMLNRLSKREHE